MIDPGRRRQAALTDPQIVRLARLGRRIEAHFGQPQDIEWCLADDEFQIVQSRPITALFPVPVADDSENHVYLSVGHQQMMTDAMKPLGLSVWQLTTPRRMAEAGGRLFVDVTQMLGSATTRAGLLETMGRSDPLMRDALETILGRGDFIPTLPDPSASGPGPGADAGRWHPTPLETDPAVVTELVEGSRASIAALQRDIEAKSGPALLDFVLADFQELKRILFDPRSHEVFMSAMEATWWLNDQLEEWLGEKNAADTLTQSVPGNVTSEMGLALLDVADVIRPHPAVVAFFSDGRTTRFLDDLPGLEGGRDARTAIRAFLDDYGMRCVGEIDITRPRWSERPATLLPLILGNIKNFDPGAGSGASSRAAGRPWPGKRSCWRGCGSCRTGRRRPRTPSRRSTGSGPSSGTGSTRSTAWSAGTSSTSRRLLRGGRTPRAAAGVLHEEEDIFYLTFPELETSCARTAWTSS